MLASRSRLNLQSCVEMLGLCIMLISSPIGILFVCVLWLCVWLSLCVICPGSLSSGSESVGDDDICESAVAVKQCEPIQHPSVISVCSTEALWMTIT